MGFLDFFSRKNNGDHESTRHPRRTARPRAARSFLSGDTDNLFANFGGSSLTADGELFASLEKMRARSRKLCNDSDFARKYLEVVKANVVGHSGIRLSPQSRRNPGGELDAEDNRVLLDGWKRWGHSSNCTVTRSMGWLEVQSLFVETVARDGECLVRIVSGFDNEFGIALQVLEGDALDVQLNRELKGGNYISLGVEKNSWGEPVAYYLRSKSRTANSYEFTGGNYERVPASEIVHGFRVQRPGQTRGVPWLNTAIRSLKMLDGWLEAELTGARIAASKMGFLEPESTSDSYVGDDIDPDGTIISEVEPGVIEQLPPGMKFKEFDPKYPNSKVGDFVKVTLRSAAAGLGISYHSLANDLESVNYSSLRAGTLEEREAWKSLQRWLRDTLCDRVYREWLKQSLLRDAFARPLPASKFDKFAEVEWIPRGWTWVDPLKDQKAAELGISLGLTTRTELAASQGRDIKDIFEQLSGENLLSESFGISVDGSQKADDKSEEKPD
tara:strand:- start:4800 stop:6299 length:1500 start_codon:yes stop_codon:yes gene_type:complete